MLNNPIKASDPSGHYCVGDTDDCASEPGKGPGGPVYNGGGGSRKDDPKSPDDKMKTSDKGKDFMKWWENGNEPPDAYPYEDMGGTCTIGYGHVLYNPGGVGCSGWPNKTYRTNPLSVQGAEQLFDRDITQFEDLINESITVDLTQAQFDALVSYTFNSGDQTNNPYFVKGVPELINGGHFEEAAAAMASGPITSGDPPKESPKLVERRQAEAVLFLHGTYGNYVPWKR